MDETMAIAFFSTWTTYGTWLPGDERGWFEIGLGLQPPDLRRRLGAALLLSEEAITFDNEQRVLVENTICQHCEYRRWILHAVNCRSNHVHVVVTAEDRTIALPRQQFKSWCTRKLKELEALRCGIPESRVRLHWWTDRGWDIYIDDVEHLLEVVAYVLERQEY
jgi:REP element-mobilizing transposase RayT